MAKKGQKIKGRPEGSLVAIIADEVRTKENSLNLIVMLFFFVAGYSDWIPSFWCWQHRCKAQVKLSCGGQQCVERVLLL